MNSLTPWKSNDVKSNSRVAPISSMGMDWDRLFERLMDGAYRSTAGTSPAILLDASETEDEVRVRAEVPGIKPEDLDIQLAGEVLTLSGKKVVEDESQAEGSYYSERHFGSFRRTIKLPCQVDLDQVEAVHENGVVTITLRKSDAMRPKRIQVKSA